MFGALWLVLPTLAVVVEGGVSSGSAEALANANGAAAAGAAAKAGGQNGVPLNGEPVVARLVQLGGSFFLQPLGGPVAQAPLQQLVPIAGLQQGAAFVAGQAGGATVNLPGQVNQQAGGGPLVLYTVLPQRGAGGDPQRVLLTPGQVQLVAVPGTNNQPQLGAAAGGGSPNGGLRFQRSVAARRRRMPSPEAKPTAAEEEEEEEEEEECSGDAMEAKQMK